MLTIVAPRGDVLRAVARTVPWDQVGPILFLGALPTVVTVVRGGTDYSGAVLAWMVVSFSVVAFAFDEPSRIVLDAGPVSSGRRTLRRLALILLAAAIAGMVTAGLILFATPDSPFHELDVRLAEASVVATASLAAASVSTRRDAQRVTVAEAACGPLVLLFVSMLSIRIHWLPRLGVADHANRWWLLAAAGLVLTIGSGLDPYRRLR